MGIKDHYNYYTEMEALLLNRKPVSLPVPSNF